MFVVFYIPLWVKVLIAVGFFGFCAFAWLVNQHLGGDVR